MNSLSGAMITFMISKSDIEKLASLARINVTEEEKEELARDMRAVLSYVDDIQKAGAPLDALPEMGDVKNVLRTDDVSHESGQYTEKILNEVPERKDNYVKVKQILS